MLTNVAKCRSGMTALGHVVDTLSSTSHGLRTIWRRHDYGFSITYLRRSFEFIHGKEIPKSSIWHAVRHVEYHVNKIVDVTAVSPY